MKIIEWVRINQSKAPPFYTALQPMPHHVLPHFSSFPLTRSQRPDVKTRPVLTMTFSKLYLKIVIDSAFTFLYPVLFVDV
jgi:hypothetical protein